MIDIKTIDWNEVWKGKKSVRSSPARNSASWDKRAPSFAENSSKTEYAEAFVKIVNPKKSWTVFDMGCGSGTLAIPFAKLVSKVTAIDFSGSMLKIVRAQCDKLNISNVSTIKASWESNWNEAGIGIHDVAIASRSLVVDDLVSAVIKLNGVARKRVYISTIVDDGPYDRRVFAAIDRKLNTGPDYIYNYNLLYQMGIRANIDFITEKTKSYKTSKQLVESVKWMLGNLRLEEEIKLNKHLDKHIVCKAGWWSLDYGKDIKWALIWWNKD
ncbi:MAG: methyltransferase domain-containing protein [Proteobacteria bacterium]|nr:methyltransferase domain-containing protein [Pseudomonadota bacterium]